MILCRLEVDSQSLTVVHRDIIELLGLYNQYHFIHMISHCHWFKSYTHYKTPICLANNTAIFSASVDNIVFEPVVNGKQVKAVEFLHVLYIPDLRSNLLSHLYFTHNKGFTIFISSYTMTFRQDKLTLFTASIDSNNSAVLNRSTIAYETTFLVSTLLANLSLWH